MSAGRYDTTIEAGATWQRRLTWLDSAGDPVPLEDYTARMQLRRSLNEDVLVEIATADGIVLDDSDGTIELEIAAEHTAELDVASVCYDLLLTSPTGVVTRLIEGTMVVIPAVTR